MRKSLRITPLAGLILMVVQPALHAKNWCTNADLVGSYGLFATGAIVLPDKTPITGPFARVGRTTFDGNGNLSNLTVASYNGNIFNEPYNGTYTVNSDCTVTFIANLSAPVNAPVTLSGVLSDNNNEVRFMLTNPPGTTIAGVIRKQGVKWCGAADFSGDYQLELSGPVLPPSPLAGGFERVGKLNSDGAGNFTANTTASYNGMVVPEPLTGTYTMDQNCVLVLKYTLATAAGPLKVTISGVLVDGGKGANLIVSDPPGAAIVGTLKAQ